MILKFLLNEEQIWKSWYTTHGPVNLSWFYHTKKLFEMTSEFKK